MTSHRARVSVLMPCRNALPFLREAVASVLEQPECLELLVADGNSSDGSLELLDDLAQADPRLKVVSRCDMGPADALNRAFRVARGSLIGWLNADDLYHPGCLVRAIDALDNHPEWLMVYGEGKEFDASSGLQQRYPTMPPSCGIEGFRSHCFICQPTVLFRRSMVVLLGEFDQQWQTTFDLDYWLRAFATFPHRIGYIPYLQGHTRLHKNTITNSQRRQAAIETTALVARHFGCAPVLRLQNYATDLQQGLAMLPQHQTLQQHLADLANAAEMYVDKDSLIQFRYDWLLNASTAPGLQAAEEKAAELELTRHLPVRLLQALHPELLLDAPGSPAGPNSRLRQVVQTAGETYPLLRTVDTPAKTVSSHGLMLFERRPFGVNLIGHALELGGNGEDIRMAAKALQISGIPCCVLHHPALQCAQGRDHSLEPLICRDPKGGPYAFNLICLSAQIQARWHLQAGVDPLRERYTVAAWPWETLSWPDEWLPLLEMVDELWPSSTFTAAALKQPANISGVPLSLMPMAAEVPTPDHFCSPAVRADARKRYGLPLDAFVFGYGFDFNSTAIRKNPMAALEAFQLAFPTTTIKPEVSLMIKTFPPRESQSEWHWLRARAAEDPRIHLVVGSLKREELLALYGCCDVFLSLHRSEGFGRGIAEALQLGLDVIASEYGGNADFCTGPSAHLVRCTEVPIPRGAYPCADGHLWGEPDLEHAAMLMQHLAVDKKVRRDPDRAATYRELFSCEAAGKRYRERLERLWKQRLDLADNLKWKEKTPVSRINYSADPEASSTHY